MKSLKVMFLAALVAGCLTVNAQAQNAAKIGYVDLSKLFDEYNKTKDYDKVLEEKHNKYVQERDGKIQKLKDQQGKLALLKEEEKAKVQEQMEKDRQALLEFDRQQQTDLRKQRDEKIREILAEIEKITKQVADQEQYTYILNDRVLVYGTPDTNLTDKVLKILNDSYPKK